VKLVDTTAEQEQSYRCGAHVPQSEC